MQPMEQMTPPSSEPNPGAGRRRVLFAGVAATAALAGAGVAWWRYGLGDLTERQGDEGGALWTMAFERPDGGALALSTFQGKPLVLNFWATWCPPCVAELPLLDRFYREQSGRGWQVVGLAVDRLDPVRAFLTRQPLHFPIALAGTGGMALGKSLGNLSGGLPFSVVFGADGAVQHRKMGALSIGDLAGWAAL